MSVPSLPDPPLGRPFRTAAKIVALMFPLAARAGDRPMPPYAAVDYYRERTGCDARAAVTALTRAAAHHLADNYEIHLGSGYSTAYPWSAPEYPLSSDAPPSDVYRSGTARAAAYLYFGAVAAARTEIDWLVRGGSSNVPAYDAWVEAFLVVVVDAIEQFNSLPLEDPCPKPPTPTTSATGTAPTPAKRRSTTPSTKPRRTPR